LLISSNYEGVKPKTQRVELPLANKEGKWLGSGMGDIFEHRIPIQQNARFDKQGMYHFSFEQNMRLNPLPHIMSVGLRVEKAGP
jgi:gliding motility-associated lipoprotein GldH